MSTSNSASRSTSRLKGRPSTRLRAGLAALLFAGTAALVVVPAGTASASVCQDGINMARALSNAGYYLTAHDLYVNLVREGCYN